MPSAAYSLPHKAVGLMASASMIGELATSSVLWRAQIVSRSELIRSTRPEGRRSRLARWLGLHLTWPGECATVAESAPVRRRASGRFFDRAQGAIWSFHCAGFIVLAARVSALRLEHCRSSFMLVVGMLARALP